MKTIGSVISAIREDNKWMSIDVNLTDRFIYEQAKNFANVLITRESNKRRLWQASEAFTVIPCLEMEEVPLASCCEYYGDKTIAKSINPLPKIEEGYFGLIIQYVNAIDNSVMFNSCSPKDYINILKRRIQDPRQQYYWVENNHLYVTLPTVESVRLSAYFSEDINACEYSCECRECGDICDECISMQEKEFKAPGYLIGAIIDMANAHFRKYYHVFVKDANENERDESK